MPRGRKKEEIKAEDFVSETKPAEVVSEETKEEETKPEPKVEVVSTGGAKELLVVCKDGTKRLYRESTHGPLWETLAKNYAKNKKACNGEIYKVNR